MLLYKLYLKKGGFDTTISEKARKHIKAATKIHKLLIEKLRNEGGAAEEEMLAYADLYYEIAKYSHDY